MPNEELIHRTQEPTPTVRELAMVLFRRRRVFVWVAGLVFAGTVLFALIGTKYQASMKVMVRRGRADAPATAGEEAPVDLTRLGVTEEELNSEVELLRDDEVLRKVAQDNPPGGRDWLHVLRWNEGPAQREEREARRLAKRLRVEPVKRTNLISVSYESADPQQAARVLRSVAQAYLEKHTVMHRPVGEFSFFDQQRGESRLQLEEAKGKLLEFNRRHGVIAAGQQRDLTLQKLSEVDANFRQTDIELAETRQRVAELEALLAKLPQRSTTQVRVADNPELLKTLKGNLLELQLKKIQLLTKFEPSHRLVQEVEQQISQTQAAIAAENLQPVRDETTDKDSHYEWAKGELQRARVLLKSLQARQSEAAVQEASYRAIARQFGEDSVTQDDLLSNEKAAQERYLLYVKKEEQARMDDALDERGIVNVAIAQQPVVPALPVWSAWTILVIGVLGAVASGTGCAFVADFLDPAFRTPEDVRAYLHAPVLASLPRRGRGRLRA